MAASTAQYPVGTGAFALDEWVRGDHLRLKRFPQYWEQGLPYLDDVVYLPMDDETVKMADLRAGSLDLVDAVPPSEQRAFVQDTRFRSFTLPGANWPNINLNCGAAAVQQQGAPAGGVVRGQPRSGHHCDLL